MGVVLGTRVLAEFGDAKNRYASAKARKNYAGTSLTTRQSGKTKTVHARPLSVYGAAHLRSAVFAARAADRQTAFAHIDHAREAARLLGGDANHYGLEFGPSNVAIHEIGVAVEMYDGTEAIRRARRAQLPPTVAPVRLGHYYIDLARGWLYHGDRPKALEMLYSARRVAPQMTRNHPMVRETVRMLVDLERRRPEGLSRFVGWLSMP